MAAQAPAPPPAAPFECDLEIKSGGLLNSWAQRFCVLEGADLRYFGKRGDTTPKGTFSVLSFVDVRERGGRSRANRVDLLGAGGARLCVAARSAADKAALLAHVSGGKERGVAALEREILALKQQLAEKDAIIAEKDAVIAKLQRQSPSRQGLEQVAAQDGGAPDSAEAERVAKKEAEVRAAEKEAALAAAVEARKAVAPAEVRVVLDDFDSVYWAGSGDKSSQTRVSRPAVDWLVEAHAAAHEDSATKRLARLTLGVRLFTINLGWAGVFDKYRAGLERKLRALGEALGEACERDGLRAALGDVAPPLHDIVQADVAQCAKTGAKHVLRSDMDGIVPRPKAWAADFAGSNAAQKQRHERVFMHVLVLMATALNAQFHGMMRETLGPYVVAGEGVMQQGKDGRWRLTPVKGVARMEGCVEARGCMCTLAACQRCLLVCVRAMLTMPSPCSPRCSKRTTDHSDGSGCRSALNIDVARVIGVCETARQMRDAVQALSDRFGGCGRCKVGLTLRGACLCAAACLRMRSRRAVAAGRRLSVLRAPAEQLHALARGRQRAVPPAHADDELDHRLRLHVRAAGGAPGRGREVARPRPPRRARGHAAPAVEKRSAGGGGSAVQPRVRRPARPLHLRSADAHGQCVRDAQENARGALILCMRVRASRPRLPGCRSPPPPRPPHPALL